MASVLFGLASCVSAQEAVPSSIELMAEPFRLEQVRLLSGPFAHAQNLDRDYLLSLDPDRLLHTFRLNAGLPSDAQPLGGWEVPGSEVRGHFTGHYMSACALMYASTGDARLKAKGDAVVAGLAECQAKIGTGYLSAYPESFIDRVEALQPVWAPYYTLHKILAGLLDMYTYCGNAQALDVCKRFGDWVVERNGRLSDEQMQRMLGNEHGGMDEVLANLYGVTGERKYLDTAMRFNHLAVIGPASQREDKLTGLHANTQIPKFIGTAREYELSGEPWLRTASEFFWYTVAKERSYVIGGHSDGEAFSPKERLSEALGPSTTETCNTYNMLKLTRHLFGWTGDADYADFYERALYNHILASQNPADGMMCYYVPLRSGMVRGGGPNGYCTPLDSFWCCTGTGIENHAKYGDSIYFHDGDDTLFVNLFIASELDWTSQGVRISQETRYPEEGTTRLTFTCAKPAHLSVKIRHPYWAVAGFEIVVNGHPVRTESKPGSYTVVTRRWETGDVLEVSMPFSLRTEAFRDNPHRLAFMNGPIVLCAQIDPTLPAPNVVAADDQILAAVQPLAGTPDCFVGSADAFRVVGRPEGCGVTLEPFYKMQGNRPYAVYFDVVQPDGWAAKEQAYLEEQERQRKLAARTVDLVIPGDAAGERAHDLQGENMGDGPYGARHWRHAPDGWFSWDLKVRPDTAQELWVTYWGSDVGPREFDVLIDGERIATQKLARDKPEEFFDVVYPLSEALTRGKGKVTVRFQAHPGNTAGGVFGCRIVLPE